MSNKREVDDRSVAVDQVLCQAYELAEDIVKGVCETPAEYQAEDELVAKARELAKVKHAARGAALTLLAYKICVPEQDIRAHKEEYDGGFSARTVDNAITVPFLIRHSLPRNVETHWLTQTLSFAPPLCDGLVLKTVPKNAGPLLVDVIARANDANEAQLRSAVAAIIYELVVERNRNKVVLTRPKGQPIDTVKELLERHFSQSYSQGAPRLPQLAIYAIYSCIIPKMLRFQGQQLNRLERLKSADRKAGTVGDIVVSEGGNPVEAVEIKYGKPITYIDVAEAIEKVRAETVGRYYLLSTQGVVQSEFDQIMDAKSNFLKQNGCEIIVNGVVDTIGYYLRLLPNTTEFLSAYASLVENDDDTAYEHRIAWNTVCGGI